MKKFLSRISVFIVALFMLLTCGFGATNIASAKIGYNQIFKETYMAGADAVFENNAMYLTYAEETLIGIDKNGKVYRAESGTPSSLTATGHTITFNQLSYQTNDNDSNMTGGNQYIVYGENTVVAVGANSSNKTVITYSTDYGKNWATASSTLDGTPITVIYGNGLFALMTAESATSAEIYVSENGINWISCRWDIGIDYNFNFSNGYFFYTQYYSNGTAPEVYYSVDLMTWDSFTSPIAGIVGSNPNLWTVRINNQFYIFGDGKIYTATNPENVWKFVTETSYYTEIYKIAAYQNGVIIADNHNFYYAEFPDDETIMFNMFSICASEDYDTTKSVLYGNTIIESNTKLLVGFSGNFGKIIEAGQGNSTYSVAGFSVWQKTTQKYTVQFLDYNGSIISSVEVLAGNKVIAPTNPSRTGYTFTGWDKDITAAINADTTFTAQYKINSYTVSFTDYNGQVLKTIEVEHGETIEPSLIPTPERADHQFTGWNLSTTAPITSNTTFVAQYTAMATLTFKYPSVTGKFGLENQFYRTEIKETSFTYLIGDLVETEALTAFYNSTLLPWINDYSSDGDYDYDSKFIAWDTEIPEYINKDLTITAQTADLHNVRLEYYSQVRFKTIESYYLCFIGYMKVERLVPTGTVIELEDFKKEGIDYESYSAHLDDFYSNLRNFEFLGWDTDITKPITKDTIIQGEYNMPTINVKMYDADKYLFKDEDQQISFLSVDDLVAMQSSADKWGYFVEVLRNFFLFRWDNVAKLAHDQYDFAKYINNVASYNSASSQILTAFVVLDVQNPDIYGGIFMEGSVDETSPILQYYKGDVFSNDLTYWINPIVFANDLYPLTCVVTYGVVLDSAVKQISQFGSTIMDIFYWLIDFIKEYWWVIVIVALVIIFRKPLAKLLSFVFDAIKKFFKWLGKKLKKSSKKKSKRSKKR